MCVCVYNTYIYVYIIHSLWRVVEREVCTNKPFLEFSLM
jgi:hypothetical protein